MDATTLTLPDEETYNFTCREIASVLEGAERELLERGSCQGHTSIPTGEVCAIGALNLAIFGPGCADGLHYYHGGEEERKIALREAVAKALGFSSFVELGVGFHDRQSDARPVLKLFGETRERLLSL